MVEENILGSRKFWSSAVVSKCGPASSKTFREAHKVRTIIIVIQRHYLSFHCVDNGIDVAKAKVGKTEALVGISQW